MAGPSGSAYAAQFTDGTEVICERPQCPIGVFPAGFKLQHMESLDKNQPGRNLCPNCYHYYLSKNTTIRRTAGKTPVITTFRPHQDSSQHQEIRQNLAKAQRGREFILQLSHVIHTSEFLETDNEIQAVGTVIPQHMGTGHTGYLIRTPTGPGQTVGPNIHLPGTPGSAAQLMPQGITYQLAGYTPNHAGYVVDRAKRVQQAYSEYNAEVVSVRVRMVYWPYGRLTHQIIAVS